jgi:hypothetical protein
MLRLRYTPQTALIGQRPTRPLQVARISRGAKGERSFPMLPVEARLFALPLLWVEDDQGGGGNIWCGRPGG